MINPCLPRVHFTLATGLLWMYCIAASRGGQVVIDIPPTPNFLDNAAINSNTLVNVHPGGSIGNSLDVGNFLGTSVDAELRVLGGFVGHEMVVNPGGLAILSAGSIGNDAVVNGGELRIEGGTFGNNLLIETDSLVNITGGVVGSGLNGGNADGSSAGIALNVSGGLINASINVWNGSHTTVTGGVFGLFFGSGGDSFNARAFSFVEIFGGIVDFDFDTFDDADVHIYGNDFRLDGEPLAVGSATMINLGPENILDGILQDGTPFALGAPLDDEIANDTLTLHSVPLPPLDATEIFVPPDPAPPSIRDGQTLTLGPGGELEELFRAGRGSTLIVTGGVVGDEAQAVGADITITSGTVGSSFLAYDSNVEITGGTIASFFEAGRGTVVNMSGGKAGTYFAYPGSQTNITGGNVIGFFIIEDDSEVNLSGGNHDLNVSASAGGSLNVFGGEFRLDGQLIPGLDTPGDSVPINLPEGSVISGTLTDGTPISFSRNDDSLRSDFIADGTLTLHATNVPVVGQVTFNLPGDTPPAGLRQGQTLTLNDGGELASDFSPFHAGFGSTLNILGGFVGGTIEASGATVNKSGGTGNTILAWGGSDVHISNGTMGQLQVGSGSVAEITGGTILSGIEVFETASVNISGGNVQRFNNRALLADTDSQLNITGGTFSGRDLFIGNGAVADVSGGVFNLHFLAGAGSEVNLSGSSFLLDGAPIDGLELGVPLTIAQRDVTLTGTWENGLPFAFDLASTLTFTNDFFAPTATLTITLVAPNLLPGDYNDDGVVNAADYVVWRNTNGQNVSLPNDTTPGSVTASDYDEWVENFAATGQGSLAGNHAVPEPTAAALFVISWLVVCVHLRWGHR